MEVRTCPHFSLKLTPGAPELCPLLLPNVNLWSPEGERICPRPKVKGCVLLDLPFPQHFPSSRPFPSLPLQPTQPVAFKGTQHFSTKELGAKSCALEVCPWRWTWLWSPPHPNPLLVWLHRPLPQDSRATEEATAFALSQLHLSREECSWHIRHDGNQQCPRLCPQHSEPAPSSDPQATPLSLICFQCCSLSAQCSSTPH